MYELLKFVLKYININAQNHNGQTALYWALEHNHLPIIRLLIRNRADTSTKIEAYPPDKWAEHYQRCYKSFPIHWATYHRYIDIVLLLIEYGADISIPSGQGLTPLYIALSNKDFQMMEILIKYGSNVNTLTTDGWCHTYTVLYEASKHWGHDKFVKLLIANGADISIPADDGYTPLHIAAACDNVSVVKLLLENGANMNTPDENGRSPQRLAFEYGHTKTKGLFEAYRKAHKKTESTICCIN